MDLDWRVFPPTIGPSGIRPLLSILAPTPAATLALPSVAFKTRIMGALSVFVQLLHISFKLSETARLHSRMGKKYRLSNIWSHVSLIYHIWSPVDEAASRVPGVGWLSATVK